MHRIARRRISIIGIGIVIAVFVGLAITWIIAPVDNAIISSSSFFSSATTAIIDGISCDTMEHLNFHIHAHLDIFINAQFYTIPSEIGIIPDKCIYWMHTHDDSGIIHIESPEIRSIYY
jgi:hypothetical protein